MNNPVDRLGQPLAVGDWVVFNDCLSPNPDDGKKYRLTGFFGSEGAIIDTGEKCYLASLTKINPKPETTTWSDMADIWAPEGAKV